MEAVRRWLGAVRHFLPETNTQKQEPVRQLKADDKFDVPTHGIDCAQSRPASITANPRPVSGRHGTSDAAHLQSGGSSPMNGIETAPRRFGEDHTSTKLDARVRLRRSVSRLFGRQESSGHVPAQGQPHVLIPRKSSGFLSIGQGSRIKVVAKSLDDILKAGIVKVQLHDHHSLETIEVPGFVVAIGTAIKRNKIQATTVIGSDQTTSKSLAVSPKYQLGSPADAATVDRLFNHYAKLINDAVELEDLHESIGSVDLPAFAASLDVIDACSILALLLREVPGGILGSTELFQRLRGMLRYSQDISRKNLWSDDDLLQDADDLAFDIAKVFCSLQQKKRTYLIYAVFRILYESLAQNPGNQWIRTLHSSFRSALLGNLTSIAVSASSHDQEADCDLIIQMILFSWKRIDRCMLGIWCSKGSHAEASSRHQHAVSLEKARISCWKQVETAKTAYLEALRARRALHEAISESTKAFQAYVALQKSTGSEHVGNDQT